MFLSPAEKSYLYDSLVQNPPIRPDGRSVNGFRPLEGTTNILPSSNGSARMRLVDGSECIISIKSKVMLIKSTPNLIDIDLDISGTRDDSTFVSNLKFYLINLISNNFPTELLRITEKYSYKLFIDVLLISHSSYPLSLISLTTYLALKTTRLPLLTSSTNDLEVTEEPTFADDWEKSRSFADMDPDFQPPIFIVLGIIGNNIIVDPSLQEEQVLENGLITSWNRKLITPMANISFGGENLKGFNIPLINKAAKLVNENAGQVVKALDALIDNDDDYNAF